MGLDRARLKEIAGDFLTTMRRRPRLTFLAACLAYLAHRQRDRVGILTFDEDIVTHVPPSAKHFDMVLHTLDRAKAERPGHLSAPLHKMAEHFKRRGILLLISDFYDSPEAILDAIKPLKFLGNDLIVFHVLDGAEIDFPFRQSTLFHGLEQLPDLLTDPLGIREGYLAEFNAFRKELQTGCRLHNIDYVELRTDKDLGLSLAEYLVRRSAR